MYTTAVKDSELGYHQKLDFIQRVKNEIFKVPLEIPFAKDRDTMSIFNVTM